MTLNKQLLCVSLLLLSLPWAGYQYLLDMSESLRERQVSLLETNSRLIANAISQTPWLKALLSRSSATENDHSFYCHPARQPIRADGYATDNEWSASEDNPFPWNHYLEGEHPQVSYRCTIYQDQLNLLFRIDDPNVFYTNPASPSLFSGDRLILQTGHNLKYVFSTAAAGTISPVYMHRGQKYYEREIKASWVDLMDGYQIEMTMPRQLAGEKLSFILVDQTGSEPDQAAAYGPGLKLTSRQLPYYLYPSADYQQQLQAFAQAGLRVKLIDQQGWLLASAGEPRAKQPGEAHWLLRQLYHRLLRQTGVLAGELIEQVNLLPRPEVQAALQHNSTHSRWYQPDNNPRDPLLSPLDYIVASATSIVDDNQQPMGALILEQSSQQTTALTDRAFNRLFVTSALTLLLVMLVLISYASWLSWRIRKLSKATRLALDSQGRLGAHFPVARNNDEIGTLSRDFAELMQRVDEYTDYLRDLSSKLSHELRTPLAIIHSSLDMLGSSKTEAQRQTYQHRAKDGATRLGNIITAMSEARRVEESLEHAEAETINICQLLNDLTAAYQDLYQPQQVSLTGIDDYTSEVSVTAVPDLLVQLIDKLMDNAHSFCPDQGEIQLGFNDLGNEYQIWVSNEGPLLPAQMQHQLFDNLVSIRQQSREQHLGMGLHIVQLICTYHQGEVRGYNRDDQTGVTFTVTLAKQPTFPHIKTP